MSDASNYARYVLCATVTLLLCLFGTPAASAAAASPWRIDSMSNTNASPGEEIIYGVQINNSGEMPIPPSAGGNAQNCVAGAPPPADSSKCVTLSATFPPEMTPVIPTITNGASCTVAGQSVACGFPSYQVAFDPNLDSGGWRRIAFRANVDPGASGVLIPSFEVAGGGVPAAQTVDPTQISAELPAFGIDAFDPTVSGDSDSSGLPFSAAGAHPYAQSTTIRLSRLTREPPEILGFANPVEPLRDAFVGLPPGLIGDPTVASACTAADLAHADVFLERPLCPSSSQVGLVFLQDANLGGLPRAAGPIPLFNVVPPPGVIARFGFQLVGSVVMFDALLHQNSEGEYIVSVAARQASEGLAVIGSDVEFWGIPADPTHTFDRACPGGFYPRQSKGTSCSSDFPREAFFRMPTSCTAPSQGLPWTLSTDSWTHPGATLPGGQPDLSDPAWRSQATESHQPPGYPYLPSDWGPPLGVEGCDQLSFNPGLSAQPTTDQADSPTGLQLDLTMPQVGFNDPDLNSESDLKSASVKFPPGMTLNPSSADGLGACTAAQIGLTSAPGAAPILFDGAPQHCPDAAKIGSLSVDTPVIDHPLSGGVYLAKQADNPFSSLLAVYLVIEDPVTGIIIKLPGRIVLGSGGLETVFDGNPQTPFEHLEVNLFGGPRAALRTPARCGTYTTEAALDPWSGTPTVNLQDSFQITSGPRRRPLSHWRLRP